MIRGLIGVIICVVLPITCGCAKHELKDDTSAMFTEEGIEEIKPVKLSDYKLGPGDVLEISVWRQEDLSKSVKVDPYGRIVYPLIGEMEVKGSTVSELYRLLKEGLSKYYVDPKIAISMISIESHKVYVFGEVGKPGVVHIDSPIGVIEAISQSGGFTHDARKNSVVVVKSEENRYVRLNMNEILKRGKIEQNIQLAAGDIIYVPATYIANISRFGNYLRDVFAPALMFEETIILGDRVGDIFGKGVDASGPVITIER
ncbi:MAG: polysaccharide biosynthesis/export family protein [Candidatus Brocadiaceae bacterium]|nr:polysaccharide biosynthesis/export family protein [Candidatus Brocadiaceae bacterium]